jgi:hypothetical protein
MINELSKWFTAFQRDASLDDFENVRDHLSRLNLPDDPDSFIEGTYRLVATCLVYANIDSRSYGDFLALQNYEISAVPTSKYVFTFEVNDRASGRLLADDLRFIDLEDLWEMVWPNSDVYGYDALFVSCADDRDLTDDEFDELEQMILEDLRYEHSEDELDIFFDRETIDGVLTVFVQDHFSEHDENL